MKGKKIMAATLAAVMIVGTVSGCGGNSTKPDSSSKKDEIELSRPTITNVESKNEGSIELEWESVKDAKEYQIEYAKYDSFLNSETENTDDTSLDITNLDAGETYFLRVKAVADEVESNWSSTEKIKVHKHDYKKEVKKAATCESDGLDKYVCECGDTYEEAVKATGHNYQLVNTVAATNKTNGYKEYKCSDCGNTYKETIKKTETATDHKSTVATKDTTKKTTLIPSKNTSVKHTHVYSVIKTVNPTCAKEGYKEYKCLTCDSSYKKKLDKVKHKYSLVSTFPSTCTKEGHKQYICTVCGDTYTKFNQEVKS